MRKGGRRYPTKRRHIYTVKTKTHSLRRKESSPLWSRKLKRTKRQSYRRSRTRTRTRTKRKRRKTVKRGGGFLGIGNSLMSFF